MVRQVHQAILTDVTNMVAMGNTVFIAVRQIMAAPAAQVIRTGVTRSNIAQAFAKFHLMRHVLSFANAIMLVRLISIKLKR